MAPHMLPRRWSSPSGIGRWQTAHDSLTAHLPQSGFQPEQCSAAGQATPARGDRVSNFCEIPVPVRPPPPRPSDPAQPVRDFPPVPVMQGHHQTSQVAIDADRIHVDDTQCPFVVARGAKDSDGLWLATHSCAASRASAQSRARFV